MGGVEVCGRVVSEGVVVVAVGGVVVGGGVVGIGVCVGGGEEEVVRVGGVRTGVGYGAAGGGGGGGWVGEGVDWEGAEDEVVWDNGGGLLVC